MKNLPQKLIKQKEFAAMAGVVPQTITKLKSRLGEAVVGRKINLNHPLAQEYLEERRAKNQDILISHREKGDEGRGRDVSIKAKDDLPVLPDEIASLTLLEIVSLYGGMPGFERFVSAHTKLADYKNKQLKWELGRNELINKKQEAKLIFEALEQLFKRFINELPVTQAQKIISVAQENRADTNFQIQKIIRDTNSNALNICKNRLIKRLSLDRDEELSRLFKKTSKSLFAPEKKNIPYEILS